MVRLNSTVDEKNESSSDSDDSLDSKVFHHDIDDIYKQLNIKKPRKGEESTWDNERIMKFMLDKDLKVINKHRTVREKEEKYLTQRSTDVTYLTIANAKPLGRLGNLAEVADESAEVSWRVTTKPYGVISHKRYLEWLGDLPAGPSEEEIKASEQLKMDFELWDNILHGRTDPPKKKHKKKIVLKAKTARQLEDEQFKLTDPIGWAKSHEYFHLTRTEVSDMEKDESLKNWDVGIHYPFSSDSGFHKPAPPIVAGAIKRAAAFVINDESEYFDGNKSPVPDKYIGGSRSSVENMYQEYSVDLNIANAEKYIRDISYQRNIEAKLKEKALRKAKKNRRRVGVTAEGLMVITPTHSLTHSYSHANTYVLTQESAVGARLQFNLAGGAAAMWEDASSSDDEMESLEGKLKHEESSVVTDNSGGSRSVETSQSKKQQRKAAKLAKRQEQANEAANAVSAVDQMKSRYRKFKRWSRITWIKTRMLARRKNRKKILLFFYHLPHDVQASLGLKEARVKAKVVEEEEGAEDSLEAELRALENAKDLNDKEVAELRAKLEEEEALKKLTGLALKRKLIEIEEKKKAKEEKDKEDAQKEKKRKKDELLRKTEEAAKKSKVSIYSLEGIMFRMKSWLGLVPPPTLTAAELLEKKKEEEKNKAETRLREDNNTEKFVESMFLLRAKQRKAENYVQEIYDAYTGKDSKEDEEYTASDFVRAAKSGNYSKLIDIFDHPYSSLATDVVDQDEGVTAAYACLSMILSNQQAEEETDNDDTLDFFQRIWLRFKRFFNRKAAQSKLDLCLKILLYKGADINFVKVDKDGDGEGIIHIAAQRGATGFITWLLSKKGSLHVVTARDKITALMKACQFDKIDTVMLLLKSGSMANINAQDAQGNAALHYAAMNGSADLCTVLLLCGANPTVRNKREKSPQEEAQVKGRMAIVEALRVFKQKSPEFKRRMDFQRRVFAPALESATDDAIERLI